MSQVDETITAGDDVEATWAQEVAKNANDGGGFRDNLNGGETINGGTTPVAAFVSPADGELYASDANDITRLQFDGFITSNTSDGTPADFQGDGLVRGFSGLTPGRNVYVKDDRTIGHTPGTYEVLAGIAISATEIFILKKDSAKISAGTTITLASADTERTENTTSYTKKKEITILKSGIFSVSFALSCGINGTTGFGRVYVNGVAVGIERSVSDTGTPNFTTYTEAFVLKLGDKVQLYAKKNGTEDCRVKEFRVKEGSLYNVDID